MIDNINNMPPYPNKNFIQKYNDIFIIKMTDKKYKLN